MNLSVAVDEVPLQRSTVTHVFAEHVSVRPEAAALIGANARYSYASLAERVDAVEAAFRHAGIGREARVAIILPSGAELAAAMLSVMCNAVAVPLDPALTPAETEHVFGRLRIDAAIVDRHAPVPSACIKSGLGNIADLGELGLLLYGDACPGRDVIADADPESVAMILRTSGTTAQPKLIAQTHRNLTARADRSRRYLALTPADRALSIAPIYYAQGLHGGLIYSLLTGGSIAYPAFVKNAGPDEFLTWFAEFDPTWFGAGPTLLLSMLERVRARPGILRARSLRFIQVGGAPMDEQSQAGVEDVFGVPVLPNYGSTEAGQMASNSFGGPTTKPGTFGITEPSAIGVCDERGRLLEPGESGEIVVRGPTVSSGAYDESGILRPLLVDGWFRTGDLGFIDRDGFVTVAGRIKDVINRGGEKISPAEIDHVLLAHPDVAEAATFPVPHPRLGEDAAAAVVLRPGARTGPTELRLHLREQLAPFKVPRRIHIVVELPKGPTGKVSRGELSQRFATVVETGTARPRSTLEIEIVQIWMRLLGVDTVDPMADFFQLGGDSLLAVQMLTELEAVVGHELPESLLFESASPRQLAAAILANDGKVHDLLVPLRTAGSKPPFLFFDGDLAGGGYYSRRLAEYIDDRPIWLLRPFAPENGEVPTIEAMASRYLGLLREAGVRPPFVFGGHCNGALVALETARQAEAAGGKVNVVVLIDAISLNARRPVRFAGKVLAAGLRLAVRDAAACERLTRRAMTDMWDFLRAPRWKISQIWTRGKGAWEGGSDESDPLMPLMSGDEELDRRYDARMSAYRSAMACYLPRPIAAQLIAFKAEKSRRRLHSNAPWKRFGNGVKRTTVRGTHLGCITTDVDALGPNVRDVLERYG